MQTRMTSYKLYFESVISSRIETLVPSLLQAAIYLPSGLKLKRWQSVSRLRQSTAKSLRFRLLASANMVTLSCATTTELNFSSWRPRSCMRWWNAAALFAVDAVLAVAIESAWVRGLTVFGVGVLICSSEKYRQRCKLDQKSVLTAENIKAPVLARICIDYSESVDFRLITIFHAHICLEHWVTLQTLDFFERFQREDI